MKTSRFILIIVVLLACSIFLIGSSRKLKEAPEKPPPVEEVKTIDDTWANPDYNVIEDKYAKIKLRDNNTWSTYSKTSYSQPLKRGTYTIVESWRGNEYKNTYYDDKTYCNVVRTTDDGIKKYELYRFSELYEYSNYGRVLEIVSSTEDFPTEINTEDSTYSILYLRQGKRIISEIVHTMADTMAYIPWVVALFFMIASW
ncbi:MAG: hypothetical protein JSV25_12660 [Spirochaetota bacterium]|nr:MAG: hypothetical protein JSV25_12660 [Spirochaetota bacterium]